MASTNSTATPSTPNQGPVDSSSHRSNGAANLALTRTSSTLSVGHANPSLANGSTKSIVSSPQESTISLSEEDDKDTQCSLCGVSCGCLQKLARPIPALIALCAIIIAQSLVVSGYWSSINTTIEKRFSMSSREIGFIYSSYEAACIPATILVSFFGHKHNRLRLIGIGAVIIAAGYVLSALPHFLSSAYSLPGFNESSQSLCSHMNLSLTTTVRTATVTTAATQICDPTNPETWALLIFCLAQVLIGIGSSPIYVVGPTFLWDNLTSKQYPIYSSVMYMCGAIGPAMGFMLGAWFLSIYIDWPAPIPLIQLNPSNSLWLGAWWLGLVSSAGFTFLTVLPLIALPKRLKRVKDEKEAKARTKSTVMDALEPSTSSTSSRSSTKPTAKEQIKDLLRSLQLLMTNPVWLGVSIILIIEQSVVTAFTTYVSKYIQTTYGIPANIASIHTGAVVITGALAGVLVGGLLMRRFQFSVPNTMKLLVGIACITTAISISLMFTGCSNMHVAGVDVDYNYSVSLIVNNPINQLPGPVSGTLSLTDQCNAQCGCTTSIYQPVCSSWASDPRTYYSPCYAGCTSSRTYTMSDGSTNLNYSGCSCVRGYNATLGNCSPNCITYIPTLILVFFQIFFTAIGQNPVNIVTLSAVPSEDSSMALGIQVFFVRILAFIPAPIYFGQLFDFSCLMKSSGCEGGGACLVYNLRSLPFYWLGCVAALKILSLFTAIITWFLSKRRFAQVSFNSQPTPTNRSVLPNTIAWIGNGEVLVEQTDNGSTTVRSSAGHHRTAPNASRGGSAHEQ